MTLSRDAQNSEPCNLFFAKVDRNTLSRQLFKTLHWLPVKERILLKILSILQPSLLSAPLMVLCHHIRYPLSVLYQVLHVPVEMEKQNKRKQTLFWARWKLLGFGYRSFSVLAGTSCPEQPTSILASGTSVLSRSSKLLKPFSLLLCTVSYSNPLTGIESCTCVYVRACVRACVCACVRVCFIRV